LIKIVYYLIMSSLLYSCEIWTMEQRGKRNWIQQRWNPWEAQQDTF